MTEQEDDVTELSARRKPAEDVTLLSQRDAAPIEPDPDPDDDDFTRFSPRTPAGAMPDIAADTEDQTRVSRRSPGAVDTPRSSRGIPLSALPPGAVGGAAAERGSFGQPAQEYAVREVPSEPVPALPLVSHPVPESTAPDAVKVRERRESARHRRLITALIVVGVTAALMTAAIFVIVAIVSGG